MHVKTHRVAQKNRAYDETSKHQLRHFKDVKTGTVLIDIFVNVIYKLIYLVLKIRKLFPPGLVNIVNKLVHAHSFVYIICKSLGKYFLYFQPKADLSLFII